MVRGRRRVQSKTRNEACGLLNQNKNEGKRANGFQGRLSHANPKKNQKITEYFQPSELEIPTEIKTENNSEILAAGWTSPRRQVVNSTQIKTDDSLCSNRNGSVGESPNKLRVLQNSISFSPSSALSQLRINNSPKKTVKARRRLNPNQSINQQISKSVSKPFVNNDFRLPQSVSNNHTLTEYFPIRRSIRKTKKTVLEEQYKILEEKINTGCEEGLEVHNFEGKGRGVVTNRHFRRGEFVLEYHGELILRSEAKEREILYSQDENTGCYMYYFDHENTRYCVDATSESSRLGRLVNHSKNGNLITKALTISSRPCLILIAKEDIPPGEEVTYDYGDRSKDSLRYHPWLNS